MTVARQITRHSSTEASALVIHAAVDVFSSLSAQTVRVYLSTVKQTADWKQHAVVW